MKIKLFFVFLFLIVFTATMIGVQALTDEEVEQIKSAVAVDTSTYVTASQQVLIDALNTKTNQIIAALNQSIANIQVNQTVVAQNGSNVSYLVNVTLTQEQINAITKAVKEAVDIKTNITCDINPYITDAGNGASLTFQKTLEQAMGNTIDKEFIDVQQFMTETLLPKQTEFDTVNQNLASCRVETQLCNNNYATVVAVANQTQTSLALKADIEHKDTVIWQYIALGLCLALILAEREWLMSFWKREKGI